MAYWLVKTEPEDYSFSDLTAAGSDTWDGVRSRQAQKYLRAMQPGDLVYVYHTGKEKAVVGVAEVAAPPFPDPTDPDFTAVTLRALYALTRPVTLREIKKAPRFAEWALVRQPRLSVMPVLPDHWQELLNLAAAPPTQTGPG